MLELYARSVPAWVWWVGGVGAVFALVAWRRGRSSLAGWIVLSVAFTGIVLVTLSPSGSFIPDRWCGLNDWRPIRPGQLFSMTHEALNVWIFFMFALATAALPRRQFPIGALLVLVTPPVIEFIQYVVPLLGRSCQSGDLVNNWMGGLAGLIVVGGWIHLGRR